MKFCRDSTLLLLALVLRGHAQTSAVPVSTVALPSTTLVTGNTASLDLRAFFTIQGITGQVVQFDTVRGKFDVALLASDAPNTVANFLNYVNRGAYTNTLVHRSVPGFIIQSGGFTISGNSVLGIPADAPVQNEFKVSNTRGTLALAKLDSSPNSATCQWFVNLANNNANLDTQNSGFTVFARVMGTGMSVADSIAALPVVDATATLGSAFNQLPLTATPLNAANLVVVRSIKVVPFFPAAAGGASVASFSATSSNSSVATATISGSTLLLAALAPGTTNVTVHVSDVNGNFVDSTLAVTVSPGQPVIVAQPQSVTAATGQTVALTTSAAGLGLTYQWFRGTTTPIAGATNATIILPAVSAADADFYFCRVTNSEGTINSTSATINVGPAGQLTRLSNLAVRANVTAGQLLIVGFSTTGAKSLLLRGVGPTLAGFSIPNFYADPKLEIYDSTSIKQNQNDDWDPTLAATFANLGAFALSAGSKDAALLATITGGYTAQLKGTGNGIALVEVYDAGGGFTPRLSNLSARNFVGTGSDLLIAGFTIDGPVAKTVLIRGVGPKLATFGVSGFLADPKLELFLGSTKIAENDSWNNALAATFASGGAFPLDAGSKDAALLITLPPGGYTAQISGADGGTGEALVEIYEVP